MERKWASPEMISAFGDMLCKQAALIETLPLTVDDARLNGTTFLLRAIASNAHAMVLLGRHDRGNEVFVVLRAFLERVITFFYLQSCSQQEYDRYTAYSMHKTYRAMERSLKVKDTSFTVKWTGDIDLSKNPRLKEAVSMFTSPRGREITRWSETSIVKKLGVIEEDGRFDTTIMIMATATFYDNCSEALHGTIYGCCFHYGAFQPGCKLEDGEDLSYWYRSELVTIFFLSVLLASQLGRYAGEKSGSEKSEKVARFSAHLRKKALELMGSYEEGAAGTKSTPP